MAFASPWYSCVLLLVPLAVDCVVLAVDDLRDHREPRSGKDHDIACVEIADQGARCVRGEQIAVLVGLLQCVLDEIQKPLLAHCFTYDSCTYASPTCFAHAD